MPDTNKKIQQVTVVTQPGPSYHEVGKRFSFTNNVIYKIVKGSIDITGDPFSHYLGFGVNGDLLFSINCMVPCVVGYLIDNKEGK